jgi:prophage regulatory protein
MSAIQQREPVNATPQPKPRRVRAKAVVEDPMMRTSEVLAATGMQAYSTLYRAFKEGRFPQPIQIGKKTIGWRRSTVLAWIDGRQRQATV